MPTCTFISFRLGLTDGVSVAASAWMSAIRSLGFKIVTVAGEGPVDRLIPGLATEGTRSPDRSVVALALDDADLVVVENLLTIPMNPRASEVVADVLRGRRAILHHHDPPWQRKRYDHRRDPIWDDPMWQHVTVNELTRGQFAERGISATTIYNGFDTHALPGNRTVARAAIGVTPEELLVVHPVRAIERKNIPAALEIAETLGGTYWLTGPAEEGFGSELERLLEAASCRVIHKPLSNPEDIYAAADVVVFPSTWEGFGNPPIEASLHRRPVVVADYPVAAELKKLGFKWFNPADLGPLTTWLAAPDQQLLEHNRALVETRLSIEVMAEEVKGLLDKAGWLP